MKHLEMELQKEGLTAATEKSEKAKEGKLDPEQELRKWRAEHEHRRRASNEAKGGVNPQRITSKLLKQLSGLQSLPRVKKVSVSFQWLIQSNTYQKTI